MATCRNTYWRTATIRVQHAYVFGFVRSMVFFGYPFVWFPSSFACYICIISVFWFFPSFWILYDIFMKKWSRLVCLLFFFVHPSKPSRRPLKPRWKKLGQGAILQERGIELFGEFQFFLFRAPRLLRRSQLFLLKMENEDAGWKQLTASLVWRHTLW